MLNFTDITSRIETAASRHGRKAPDISLIAVSKKQPEERIQAALDIGHRLFGENRVQEAKDRWQNRRKEYLDLKLHLIGPLQSNKTAEAVALFDVIETVDRPKIAKYLADEMEQQNRRLPCYIQINIANEPQKSGVTIDDFDDLYTYAKQECQLNITGVMCIPPLHEASDEYFRALKALADKYTLPNISMGMSNDFETAIKYGATHVRIGSALFGERP